MDEGQGNGHDRRGVWLVVGLAAVLALLVLGYRSRRPASASVERRDLVARLLVQGQVVAPVGKQAEITSRLSAPVSNVYTSLGARVEAGAVLVELAYPSAEELYEQARRDVKEAEGTLEEALQRYQAPVEEARRRLEDRRADERQAIAASLTPPPVEQSSNSPEEADQPSDVEAATQARIQAEQDLAAAEATMEERLLPYRRRLDSARQLFNEAEGSRKVAMLRTPISGTVIALHADVGQLIERDAAQPVAVVVDLSALEVHAPLRGEAADRVEPGMPAEITFAELPDETFRGSVARIESGLDPRPAVLPAKWRGMAVIAFRNRLGRVKPGLAAAVSIRTGQVRQALVVPVGAVNADATGRPIVRVLRDGAWSAAVVETGLSDGEYVEIRSGLQEGDTVQVRARLF